MPTHLGTIHAGEQITLSGTFVPSAGAPNIETMRLTLTPLLRSGAPVTFTPAVTSNAWTQLWTAPASFTGQVLITAEGMISTVVVETDQWELTVLGDVAATADLCTLAQVREFLQKPAADTAQDSVIAATIARASALIIDECQREFAPRTTTESRDFAWYGGWVNLAPYDAANIDTVIADPDGDSPITVTDWQAWPLPSRHGVITDLIVPTLTPPDGAAPIVIRVTGDWGFPAVPDAVQHACVLTVATHLRRDVAAFTTTFNLDENRVERPMSLPSAAWSALQPYRRTVSA